ncbi:MAG TPA: D-alanyl-D-alanine carboxypeptidase family protein [Desulfotignum sp.]|nr:D-alanyl-D-alanine carboxypeptidase family protein [Desulfotignum sp.]
MKKYFLCVLIILMVASFAAAKETRKAGPGAVAAKELPQPPFTSLIVMEAATGDILEEINPDLKHPLASVTKLMTALVVMDRLASGDVLLTDTVTTSAAASRIGGSQVYLKHGESFTLEQMMKALLVASGNDAAYALAEHLSGTIEAFVAEMNQTARRLGMNDTEFHSVHGLPPSPDRGEDTSTCRDLMRLSRELLKHPKLLEWTAIQTDTFRDGAFIMNSHNKLLGKLPGADGLKTGYYRKAGFNVVATAQKDGVRLIVAVLGSPSAKTRDNVALEQFKKHMARYQMAALARQGQEFGDPIRLKDGKTPFLQAVAAADLNFPVLREKAEGIQNEIRLPGELKGRVEQGQKLGEATFTLDGRTLGTADLVSPVAVERAGIFTRLLRRAGIK